MAKKVFVLDIDRIRLDLGNDLFVDANEASGMSLLSSNTIKGLCLLISSFVISRNGQIIEMDGSQITFDTAEMTVYGYLEKVGGGLTLKEINEFEECLSNIK